MEGGREGRRDTGSNRGREEGEGGGRRKIGYWSLLLEFQDDVPFHILLTVMAWLSSNKTRPKQSTQAERSPRGDTEMLFTDRRSSGMLVLGEG